MNNSNIPYAVNQLTVGDEQPIILFVTEDELIQWVQNNVMSIKEVEAYLAERGHAIQHRAVYYAITSGRLKAWRTGSGTRLTLKSWVDECWNLNKDIATSEDGGSSWNLNE